MTAINTEKLCVAKVPDSAYPLDAFEPDATYPELAYAGLIRSTNKGNHIYGAVRQVFHLLALDEKNYGTKLWNPLGDIINPGNRVVIKPNLVKHERGRVTGCVMTHAAVLRPIIDYCLLALQGTGKISICDVPLQSADFDLLKLQTGMDKLMDSLSHHGSRVELIDMRLDRAISDESGFFVRMEGNNHGTQDFVDIDLGGFSMLEPLASDGKARFAVDDYEIDEMRKYHQNGVHRYLIPKRILDANVFINVPKLKTHQKAGITVSLKNLIGINARKDRLPHFRRGLNGDEYYGKSLIKLVNSEIRFYLQKKNKFLWKLGLSTWRQLADLEQKLSRMNGHVAQRPPAASLAVKHGAWYGNDTVWRTILDVNRILFYATAEGNLANFPQRRYLSIVDGIIAGEGDGPIHPNPKPVGLLLAGFDPVLVDALSARLMGFDPWKIPQIGNSFAPHRYPLTHFLKEDLKDLTVTSNVEEFGGFIFKNSDPYFRFKPAPGWLNQIEFAPQTGKTEEGMHCHV